MTTLADHIRALAQPDLSMYDLAGRVIEKRLKPLPDNGVDLTRSAIAHYAQNVLRAPARTAERRAMRDKVNLSDAELWDNPAHVLAVEQLEQFVGQLFSIPGVKGRVDGADVTKTQWRTSIAALEEQIEHTERTIRARESVVLTLETLHVDTIKAALAKTAKKPRRRAA